MKVADVMTARVFSISPSTSVVDAARLMLNNNVSGLPVVNDQGTLIGIITEGDLLRRGETGTTRRRARWLELVLSPGRLAEEYVHTHGRKVEEVMTREVATTTEETPLETVVEVMERRRIKRLPVVRGGQVVGIVSRANLLHALAGLLTEPSSSPATDRTIRKQIVAEVAHQQWAPKYTLNFVVRNGIVDMWGTIFDERERQALRVIVENVPGVKTIRDHVAWIEPMSGAFLEAPGDATPDRVKGT